VRALERAERAVEELVSAAQPIYHWDAKQIARAVLMAVREPGSDAVAGMLYRLDNGALGEDYDTTDVWQAGIRAILGEGEGE